MTDRETMQAIMQILGPKAVCLCAGCQWETNEAIRLLQDAGIFYKSKRGGYKPNRGKQPLHDYDAERRGNETK